MFILGTSRCSFPSLYTGLGSLNAVLQVQVESGAVEFDPSPAKSRALIESSYTVPYTMLVQFENDNIDETQEMTRILKTINSAGNGPQHRLPGSMPADGAWFGV